MLISSIVFSFVAGLASFFAPCVVALLPVYLAYITGLRIKELNSQKHLIRTLTASLYYVLGFTLVFVLLGTTAASVGYLLRDNSLWLQRLGGLFVFILGLDFLGFINIAFAKKEFKIKLPEGLKAYKNLNAFFLGTTFALAWTPCASAALGSILTLAAVEATVVRGAVLLFVYSLGISLPFIFTAVLISRIPNLIPFIKKYSKFTNVVAGTIMLIIGALLITDTFKYFNAWVFDIL